ncbi:MAG: class I SAM-dependent methyltransferase [Proteobacteria bacterium]|nr:class I SAM-dependent methyltransferase [Pseudomonadota bacterium]MBU4258695.1 class I SAM-dependent methyltransferase [Pseudomonadota bacterium]MBU4287516.1 class I SAM-dependent methyltransferase [Pseudomonadota bacterium]MBU4415245.1 class I SAM-dependent methyltransferase [Pseudomonadota bacterium]MCG2757072.1 class I SAM-dependent methyltransferase [Desulfobacteraceae bacterium]
MNPNKTNRFQDFFEEDKYIFLKNYLYNYLLRKMAVENNLLKERPELILEVGSGISPVMTRTNNIIYSDLSFTAMQILKNKHGRGLYIVSDGTNLPFKPAVFSHAICSEVIEHIIDDRKTLRELAGVIKPSGRLIVTFPHRKLYFANDDIFVNHIRRYEIPDMKDILKEAGLRPIHIQKVLGPLEKITMCLVVFLFSVIQKIRHNKEKKARNLKLMKIFAPVFEWTNRFYMGLVWLDARIMPRAFSTNLMIISDKPPMNA